MISAGASSLTKLWVGAVAAFGGVGAITGAIAAFWGDQSDSVRTAAIVALAVVLGTAFVAIAVIVQSDVQARATATAARRSATSDVVAAMLNNFKNGIPDPTPVYSANYAIKRQGGGEWIPVEGFSWDAHGLKATLSGQCGVVDAAAIVDLIDLRQVVKQS